jgi:ankyrin repeat protein
MLRHPVLSVLFGFEFSAAAKLLRAADNGDRDTVYRILERKPHLALFSGFAPTLSPLHRAVKRNDLDMCRAILQTVGANSVTKMDSEEGSESLLLAVSNQKSHRGQSPLMMACQGDCQQIVESLLEAGADPLEYDEYTSRNCLHYAAMAGNTAFVEFLTSDEVTVERRGTRIPLRECVLPDIQVGSSKFIDQRSFGGLTPLHFAAVAGNLDCANILMQRGAAIMVKTDGDAFIGEEYLNPGSTPLHVAVLTNNIHIAHTIIAAHSAMMGQDPSSNDTNGQRRGRRVWEGSSRTDIRSVRNSDRKLPYHLARERRRRDLMHLVDPRINADFALDQVRDAQLGLGAMRLSSLCCHAIQSSLLKWLDGFEKLEIGDARICERKTIRVKESTERIGDESVNYQGRMGRGLLNPNKPQHHGRHATADELLLDRISTRIASTNYEKDSGEGETLVRPAMIRVQSENGLGQLAGFGRCRLPTTNLLLQPDTPDALIKSESFDNDQETKDSDSTGSDRKGSMSDGSTQHSSLAGTECGVCLDAVVDVEFNGCGHQLCLKCTRSLTLQNKRPPICPFCRQDVYMFKPATHS